MRLGGSGVIEARNVGGGTSQCGDCGKRGMRGAREPKPGERGLERAGAGEAGWDEGQCNRVAKKGGGRSRQVYGQDNDRGAVRGGTEGVSGCSLVRGRTRGVRPTPASPPKG